MKPFSATTEPVSPAGSGPAVEVCNFLYLGEYVSDAKGHWFAKHKNRLIAMAICVAIIGGCLTVLVRHYQRPAFSEDLVAMVENFLLDWRFLQRGEIKPSGKVGILAIDEKSLQKFGRWPIARKDYEPAFKNLKKLGVEWIGFDVVWSEPERPLLQDVMTNVEQIKLADGKNLKATVDDQVARIEEAMAASYGDQAVARMVSDYEKIVMGYFYYANKEEAKALGDNPFRGLDDMMGSAIEALILPDGMDLSSYPGLRAHAIVGNTPYIAKHAQNFAFFNNESDSDAIMRWVTLVREVNGNLMPSLSLKMASKILGREIVTFFDNVGITEISLMNPEDDQDLVKIPVDHHGYGRILINHYGPDKTLKHYSLADAYDNKFTDEQRQQLKGMSMILGPTAIAINDQRANPFDAGLNGVENHAAVVDNILSSKYMRRTEKIYMIELMVVLGVGIFFAPVMVFGKAAFSGMAALLFMVGYYYFDKYFWFNRGEWVYIGMPLVEISFLFIGTTLYKYMTEERERKRLKGAFSLYLSPEYIDQMMEDPDALKLGGEKKELTVFFSDVRGFTTISERLTPEKLCEFMNDYFTPMTSIIMSSKGCLDKYIGDAIMAFWGAPIPLPNHADIAVKAAIEMLFALDKLRGELVAKGFPAVDIGIGLNTGPMSVGNMGSGERFTYTVMGDNVNLASRIEGLTKEYGIKLMISEYTRRQLTDNSILVRDLDDIRVQGKHEPVKVFEAMRPDILPKESAIRDLIGEFELGRAAYRSQKWDEANKHFMKCLTIRPDDGPTDLFLKRIAEMKAAGAQENWDGVYVFTHK
jgi:adenylate cyclase